MKTIITLDLRSGLPRFFSAITGGKLRPLRPAAALPPMLLAPVDAALTLRACSIPELLRAALRPDLELTVSWEPAQLAPPTGVPIADAESYALGRTPRKSLAHALRRSTLAAAHAIEQHAYPDWQRIGAYWAARAGEFMTQFGYPSEVPIWAMPESSPSCRDLTASRVLKYPVAYAGRRAPKPHTERARARRPWSSMDVGDVVVLPARELPTLKSSLSRYAHDNCAQFTAWVPQGIPDLVLVECTATRSQTPGYVTRPVPVEELSSRGYEPSDWA